MKMENKRDAAGLGGMVAWLPLGASSFLEEHSCASHSHMHAVEASLGRGLAPPNASRCSGRFVQARVEFTFLCLKKECSLQVAVHHGTAVMPRKFSLLMKCVVTI